MCHGSVFSYLVPVIESIASVKQEGSTCDREKLLEVSNGESSSSDGRLTSLRRFYEGLFDTKGRLRQRETMLACLDPTLIAFFQYTFPAHKVKASDNYRKTLDLALNTANNQEIKDKLKIMRETADILCHNVHSTNLNLHKEINILSLNKDESLAKNTNLGVSKEDQEDQKEEDINEIEEFFISKGNDDKVYKDGIDDGDSDNRTWRRKIN
ncbi:4123_t:CDS:2 [Funneliformis caledonium]|uniref:4123_t:CDS:1 n=1 Tax=Funneliformis caledonium TaxID=1117310 RepID=A0A9N8V8S8_9GLOM|nr:4123_t:CDS:2 [Funneliformis caledonium]